MPSTTTQRKLASQFIAVTNATKESAAHYLRTANYNLDAAINLYFSSADAEQAAGQPSPDEDLNKMFDGLLSQQDREADESNNTMGAESLEQYVGQLGVNHVNYELFVLLDIVEAEGLGQISRKGFVNGWRAVMLNRDYQVEATISSQKRYVRKCIDQLPGNATQFKKLYQRAFLTGKEPQQKAVDKDIAMVFWDMLFDPAVHPWRSKHVNWLEVWKGFLEEKWKRSVNRDMWNQTLIFAGKTMEDETLGFWNEDQAWPSVIDDFVAWCRETNVVAAAKGGAETMEVDE
ncbi:Cullin binding-domain-containing protein [Echria macrotheca]|uniref:Defective in cullin neddylation protein n=1 Tax=Echria macrotheca TaxID=438768 RepID=A0AAJ0B5A5_9PEZI|nr:Cullin binding-domain-containing protein [Echria macrotheca]